MLHVNILSVSAWTSWKQHLCIHSRLPPTLVDRWPARNHGQMVNDSIYVFKTAPLPHTEVTYRKLRVTVVSLEPCCYKQEADGDCNESGALLLHTGSGVTGEPGALLCTGIRW